MKDPYSPRKAARQSRAHDTVESILQASAQIVLSQGLSLLTTNRIAERAGVSVGSLYQYFPGRDAVLHSLIEREFNRGVDVFIAGIEAIDPTRVSLDDAIVRVIDLVFGYMVQHRPFYRQLLLAALSIKHMHFTLANDARVLSALRAKLLSYGDEVDREGLDLGTFALLYALKGVQIGVIFGDRSEDVAGLRALFVRMAKACLVAGGQARRAA